MSMNCFSGNIKTLEVNYEQIIAIVLCNNYEHSSRTIAEGELQFACQEKNSVLFQQQFPPSSQPNVGPEGKVIEQVEREVHSDNRRIYSVFQERFGTIEPNGRFSISGR